MSDSEQLLNIAISLQRAGRLLEAEAAYRKVTEADAACVPAWGNLGFICQQLGRADQAARCFEQISRLQPLNPHGFNHLGIALGMQGKFEEAEGALRTAIALEPTLAVAHSNLGNTLRELGRMTDSETACRKAVALAPDDPIAHNNLAATLLAQSRHADAIDPARRAIALRPDLVEAHHNLGLALFVAGRKDESLETLRRAVQIRPTHVLSQVALAMRLREVGELAEALSACRKAIDVAPKFGEAHNILGTVLQTQGRVAEAIESYRKASEIQPTNASAGENLLLAMHYVENVEPSALFDEHRRWASRHAQPTAPPLPRVRRTKLRVGFVSPDFRQHSVAYFVRPLLKEMDRERFDVHCFSDVATPDDTTESLRAFPLSWHESKGWNTEQFAEQVRAAGIDVLIDCAGHTAGNRLPAFALRCAPAQVTFLGYPDTTAIGAMDWRITDSLADPPGESDALHTERLVRLDPCAWCYAPSADSPKASARPKGPVTFGSFNNLPKLTPRWVHVWSEILHQTDGSMLILKTAALRDAGARKRLHDLFAAGGIDPDRVELLGPQLEMKDHLASYAKIDIALDTFPYHGTTTTCEAMWMGVPVVTMAGRVHASRVGVSLLSAVGMQELVAHNDQEYVTLAVELASDAKRRGELRKTLRKRMIDSPLMDALGYTRLFETALKQM